MQEQSLVGGNRQTMFSQVDDALDRLEGLSLRYSMFLEELENGSKSPMSEDPAKQVGSFKSVYHGLPDRLRTLHDRFEMHLSMLREMLI